ncbi:beta strand repeat-containing protein [Aliarcobacter butzleri]
MAQVGIVKTLEGGVFYAKDSSGNIRELSIGDSISENEVVYGDSSNQTSAKVEMELSGNDIIVLNQAQQQLIDSSLNQVTFGNEEVIFSKGDINTTFENADLSAWNNTTDDVSDDMETAAGDPTQQETQAGEEEPTEEGRVTARFSARDGSSTDVRSDLRDTIDFGTQLSEGDNDDEIAAELLNPQTTTTTPTTPVQPDTTATPAPTVVITEDANNDGLISKAELDGKVDVTITVPTEANVGDTLNVKNPDGTTTTVEITADIKTNGYKTSYDAPAEGGTITVSATITDKAGNTSAEGKDSAVLDTTATPAPTVVITEDANNDGLISKAELDGKVDVTITVPTEANVGDTLNVKNPDGTTTTVEITADIKTNGYKTSYDAPAEGGTITVSATITDKAGNTSAEGKDSAVLDTTATPAPTVVITEDANNDGLISKAELDGKVDVTITVPTEANVGDTLNVKNPDGTTTTVEITADIKTNGYKTSYDAPAEGGTITVSATITDKAGNTSAEGKDSAVLDTTATPAPTVVITEDANNDGLISKAELDGKVDVTITVPTEANVGDTLNVKNPDGTTTTVEITADIKTNGYKTSYDAPAEGGTITVSATITDKAGNTSAEGKDSAVLDTTATPAPTVVITEDANNDGLISKAELDGKVDVTITVPTEANVGDTLNVKNPDGTTTTVEITADIKTNGYKTSYDAPAEGGTITVSATITDKAGNTSAEGKDSAVLDTTATPAPTVVITEDANNDGLISKAELDGKVDVTITVPTEANVGDTLNVKNPDGTTTTVEITADIKTNGYKTSYDAPAEGGTITVSATITDKAGNTSAEGKDSAVLDTTATPAPTVVITEDANNDGLISKAELDGKVDVTITVPTEANVGDTLNVKNPDGTTTTVEITADIKTNGYKTSYDAPAEGGTITVSATITDKAGNTSAEGKDSAVLDTTATPAPTVVITEDANNDGLISKAELDGKVDVTITVPTEANVGDTLNVKNPDGTTTTVEITADIKTNGYKTSYDAPAEGGTITVSATITDKAGNTSAEGKDSAVLDTTATPAPTVVITEDANNDGLISKAELDGKVDVTITVPTEANVGDTLNVKNPDGTTTTVEITADIKTNGYKTSYDAPAEGGTITVSATITDKAGNTSAEGKDSAVLDTTATPAPTVVITEDANNDGLISKAELDGKVDVTITVPTEANVGDTLNVKNPDGTTTTVEITADIKTNGYKTSYDAPAEGGTITVSATITDKAGNTSAEGKDSAVLDTTQHQHQQ